MRRGAGRNAVALTPLVALAFLLAGCNSSEEGGSAAQRTPLPGLWQGDLLGGGSPDAITGFATAIVAFMLYPNGQGGGRLLMLDDTGLIYDGAYTNVGSNGFDADDVRRYEPGSPAGAVRLRIDGQVRSDNTLVARIRARSGSTIPADMHLTASTAFLESSGLNLLANFDWQGSVAGQFVLFNVNATPGGPNLFGTQATGCGYSGSISNPDPQRNLYSVQFLSDGNCPTANSNFSGFAALYNGGTLLRILVAGNGGALHFQLTRV